MNRNSEQIAQNRKRLMYLAQQVNTLSEDTKEYLVAQNMFRKLLVELRRMQQLEKDGYLLSKEVQMPSSKLRIQIDPLMFRKSLMRCFGYMNITNYLP